MSSSRAVALPPKIRLEQAKADAVIAFATKVMDWPTLYDAIDRKIEDQAEFVRWWDEHVRSAGGNASINADLRFLTKDAAEAATKISQQQVSRWRKRLKEAGKYREQMILAAFRKAELAPRENHRAEGTGENEWFTPEQYIAAARDVMGGIDLDPATHPAAQTFIKADRFFTRVDDSLTKEWGGRVWLNPPYAQPFIAQFVEKMIAELSSGRIDQAIMLTHNYTDTAWFHAAESMATAICFTRGRIRFTDVDGEECSPTQGQAFFYFGNNSEDFAEVFQQFGFVR